MTTNLKAKKAEAAKVPDATKHQRMIDLLSQNTGISLEELSAAADWLPHSARAFLTGLKKKGFVIGKTA